MINEPIYLSMNLLPETSTLLVGDSREVLRGFPASTFSACVTDPPYELGFMGKKWDSSGIAFDMGLWREVFRVMKPGAHLLAFGGTRTSHRMVCAIEDAGFEIRDSLAWIYGQGFPKSLNVTKAMDRADGVRGEVVGHRSVDAGIQGGEMHAGRKSDVVIQEVRAAASAASAAWEGWGTALKPAMEPICLARKPLMGTVVENVRAHGCGALNIDGCRIGIEPRVNQPMGAPQNSYGGYAATATATATVGRWPANVLIDEEAAHMMDAQSGVLTSGEPMNKEHTDPGRTVGCLSLQGGGKYLHTGFGDTGGASRFFYCAKASTGEREAGLREAAAGVGALRDGGRGANARQNTHPTVKPIALMEWLLRLVSPPGAHVLDPFAGSGTTLVAAKRLGITATGIELDPAHAEIIRGRLTLP